MALSGSPVAVISGVAEIEGLTFGNIRFPCRPVADDAFFRDIRESHSTNSGVCACKAIIDHCWSYSNRFEDLSTLIGVEDTDAHLRHDFQ